MVITVLLIAATIALAAFSISAIVRVYTRYRGTRLVTCPETQETAAVQLDAKHAFVTRALGETQLRLSECSRWPEREDCGQGCLRQIERAPEGCLVRRVVGKWYEEEACALCHQSFGAIQEWGHQLAIMGPDGTTSEWGSVPAEKLPALFATCKPVCWNCHIAESFRRLNPDLVIDRPPDAVHRKTA